MPGDATHVRSAKLVAGIGAVVLFAAGISPLQIVEALVVFMFTVMYLSPDLDLPRVEPVKRWGWLGILWAPFEKTVAHRSKWSHGWILGAITIQLYFLMIASLVIIFLKLCWLPFIEPLIADANQLIDEIVSMNISSDVWTSIMLIEVAALAAHWHHKILDTLMKN
jgi:uncharacterized metal-binding protein